MKTNGYKCIVVLAFSLCTLAATAQSDLTIKVTNVRSAEGKCKLYVFHDENGNSQLDRENGVPSEHCAIVDLTVKADTKTVDVKLVDAREESKKK